LRSHAPGQRRGRAYHLISIPCASLLTTDRLSVPYVVLNHRGAARFVTEKDTICYQNLRSQLQPALKYRTLERVAFISWGGLTPLDLVVSLTNKLAFTTSLPPFLQSLLLSSIWVRIPFNRKPRPFHGKPIPFRAAPPGCYFELRAILRHTCPRERRRNNGSCDIKRRPPIAAGPETYCFSTSNGCFRCRPFGREDRINLSARDR